MQFDLNEIKARPSQYFLASVAVLAVALHAAFLMMFVWTKVVPLALLNIVSISAHAIAFVLIARDYEIKGFVIMVMEVAAHAIFSTYYIGWSSGFHYYFIVLLPMIGLSATRTIKTKVLLVLVIIISYVIFDFEFRLRTKLYVLPEKVIEIFYYFNLMAAMITLAFIAFCYHYVISQAKNALTIAANTDPLTQLSNRRCFMNSVDLEMRRILQNSIDLSFIICDLDHFKSINDQYGHETGDIVLKSVANLLVDGIRKCDKLSRWGGEEFLIMLPNTSKTDAFATAEHLRRRVESLDLFHDGKKLNVSMTLGVTSLNEFESAGQAIARADSGLYEGKNSGRNRVVLV